jgi:asparagine synthase (glutamine-hydrolysing)
MSGVFGVIAPERQLNIQALVSKMAAVMSHREWFVTESMVDHEADVAIGRVGIGIFNKSPQPVWNSTRTVALVMAGEIYNANKSATQSDEQLALALYEQYGENFVKQLNGAFIIGIWDKPRQQLFIVNDRFGLYPLYYAHHNGKFLFAPEMKGILCDHTFSRRLDLAALAQYIRFQQLLGERTFFEDIQVLPPASLLIYDLSTSSFNIKPYWTFADIPYRPEVSFGEAVEETGRLFRKAVQRLSSDVYRPGVYLSGGLDSRVILGMIERRPVVSLTYGLHNCRDVYYAQRVAQAVGSEHHWFDLPDGEWIKEYADFHLNLTEGFHSWIHAHGINTLAQARQLIDVNLTGWDGGTVMGHQDSIEPLQNSAVDDMALTTRLFYLFNQKYTWPSTTEAEEKLLYTATLGRQMWGVAFDSFRGELSRYFNYRPDVRSEYFYLRNHCGRSTQNLVTFTRSHVEVRFPFFDYDLFDFLYSLPAAMRGHRLLYRAMLQRELPRLAYIPYGLDEFLPTTYPIIREAHAAIVKFRRRFNRHVWPIFPDHFTLYADYENYLRYELREWAEAILFDPHTTNRGIFNPAMLRSLMDRHLSGREEWTIGKIAPLITYEMMLRRFYD